MKFIRDRIKPYFTKLMYAMFLRSSYSDTIDKKTLDKFINFGVAFTNLLLNIGMFFALYIIFAQILLPKFGFEKTLIIQACVVILLIRAFLEEFT